MLMRRYAVVGSPARHSLSPWLHGYFARLTQRDIVYAALTASPDGFAACAGEFFRAGGCGLNITAPFKADSLRLADAGASAFARRAGVANVLARQADGGVFAYNTDGGGFLRALAEILPGGAGGRKVLLLGAGGAARAVAFALAGERPAALWIWNRTPGRAEALAAEAGGGAAVAAEIPVGADIVVNATSAAARGEEFAAPVAVFGGAALAMDLSYGAVAGDFLARARRGGAAKVADGVGMLVWQAALSFAIWEKVMPPAAAAAAMLRAQAARAA